MLVSKASFVVGPLIPFSVVKTTPARYFHQRANHQGGFVMEQQEIDRQIAFHESEMKRNFEAGRFNSARWHCRIWTRLVAQEKGLIDPASKGVIHGR